MTIPPNRIEAAARAVMLFRHPMIQPGEVEQSWRDYAGSFAMKAWVDEATKIITAAYPELANGTAWLAPIKATEGMWKAADAQCNADEEIELIWSAMRDAFLQEPKDEGT